MLRLQRILLRRELDMSLVAIATVLGGERDQLEALRAHQRRLLADRDRPQLFGEQDRRPAYPNTCVITTP